MPVSDRRHPFTEGHCATSLPLVSVIVRSLDRETLAQALDSLAAQTHPLIEILLVNARGSDHRPAPDLWGERPVRFIDSSQPVPRAAAANRGLDAARGDWLLFLDDDDFLAPDHLAGLLEAVGQSRAQAAYSHCQVVDGAGHALPQRFAESFGQAKLLAGNFLPIHSVLFARTLLSDGCRIDESLDRFEDWDFWLQVAQHTDFIEVPRLTAFYRIDAGTGFGVSAPIDEIHAGALLLAAKWRERVTPQGFLDLMELARQNRYLEQLRHDLAEQARARLDCQARLDAVLDSTAWRLTAPLRRLLIRLRVGRRG
ncbi:glycosyltransferase [Thiobaca trueperi]|uniref:Glycosyl transferase family 2 n=1 Tax=Thiobaca trueperi TaxID=127458 RepID=A0A4R3N240_9GAMM|nr:glycosyltransferase [Thiobaca trueperi]TCT22181.1 glycosyl transferase family 2 [Thiobaca trueperi]